MATLAAIAVFAFGFLYTIDHYFTGGPAERRARPIRRDGTSSSTRTTSPMRCRASAAMIAGVLGIVITRRLAPRPALGRALHRRRAMFLRDRTNIVGDGVLRRHLRVGVVAERCRSTPTSCRALHVLAMMATCAFGLVMMLPYFAYVFRFLEPTNLVARIQREAVDDRRAKARAPRDDRSAAVRRRRPPCRALEELTDITRTRSRARTRSSRAARSTRSRTSRRLPRVKNTRRARSGSRSAMASATTPTSSRWIPSRCATSSRPQTWLEWKALRQYLGIYAEAQGDDARHQLPDRDRHALHRRGRRARRTTSSSSSSRSGS